MTTNERKTWETFGLAMALKDFPDSYKGSVVACAWRARDLLASLHVDWLTDGEYKEVVNIVATRYYETQYLLTYTNKRKAYKDV